MMRLLHPGFLALLLPLVALAFLRRRRAPRGLPYPSLQLLGAMPPPHSWRNRLAACTAPLLLIGGALCVLALARPYRPVSEVQSRRDPASILLLLDTSASMLARPAPDAVSGFEAASAQIARFVDRRAEDELGLLTFSSMPRLRVPLTTHHGSVRAVLQAITPGAELAGAGPLTDLGLAVATGCLHLQRGATRTRVLVLFTDGLSTLARVAPLEAAAVARALDIRLYLVGIRLDPDAGAVPGAQLLQQMADTTAGRYFEAGDPAGMAAVLSEIDALERPAAAVREHTARREGLLPFLLAAVAAVSLGAAAGLASLGRAVP